jgi:ABC-type Zn2+ transport system, periplasmic component/surface adhesin
MLTVFWDSQGLLLEHYQRGVSAVNNACYSGVLCDKLKPAIWSKRWGLLSDGVVLLPDSASPHTAAHTVETLKKLNFEVLRYWSNHCLVLTLPLETHMFKPLKQALRGCQFTMEQQLKETVHAWLFSQPKTFYSEGKKNIVQ